MTRHVLFTALLLAGTACSAQPQDATRSAAQQSPSGVTPQQGMSNEGPSTGGAFSPAADKGPQGPVIAGSNDPVPPNAPPATVPNKRATTGRANLPTTAPPFTVTPIGQFEAPFAMTFLPDGSLLVTEKAGHLRRRLASGAVQDVSGVPPVAQGGQGGLLGVAVAPDYAQSHAIYLSYAEPRPNGGSSLALLRATLSGAALQDQRVIWRAGSDGPGGQFGAKITFSPDGKYLFLTSGERQRFTPAQDPHQLLGKVVRLTLDGQAAPGNPFAGKGPAEAMIWTMGHRNPYGILFTPDGRLWEEEMGPKGGDELNLLLPGKNYGWPLVSNGDNYSGQPIPDQPSRPDFEAPKLWWNPSISPGGMIYYTGAMFPQLRNSLLIGALGGDALLHVTLQGDHATPVNQWDMGTRIRDIAQASDGSVWLLEDGGKGAGGRLLRLTPKA